MAELTDVRNKYKEQDTEYVRVMSCLTTTACVYV